MSEFVEQLASEVKSRRLLWDTRNKNYHNRALVDKEWNEVADNLGETKEAVRAKWKNLRDTFRKEVKKIPKYCGDDGEQAPVYQGTWPHFEAMLFLRYFVTSRSVEGNAETTQSDICIANVESLEGDISESNKKVPKLVANSQPTVHPKDPVPPRPQRNLDLSRSLFRKRKVPQPTALSSNFKKKLLDLEAKKVALLCEKPEDDEEMSFFRSLVPHVKQLPVIEKLHFRSKVQMLLAEELSKLQQNEVNPCPQYRSSPLSSCASSPVARGSTYSLDSVEHYN